MTQVSSVFERDGAGDGPTGSFRTPASTSAPGAVVEEMEIEDPMNEADAADLEEEQT